MEFQDRTVLITGAGRANGQGFAEARHLAGLGATVLIADICDAEGREAAASLGGRARYLHLDVSNEEDWAAAMAVAQETGGLHGLVNNAAVYIPRPLVECTAQEFNLHMQVNQLGVFLGMKFAAPVLASAGGGSIVNVSSTAGLRGSARAIAYCGTKWAIRGMSKAAAVDLARFDIRVNSIHPGPIVTGMLDGFTAEQRRKRLEIVPLGREGTVEEVAELVAFLLSERSAYITGAEIAIDGGLTV